PIFALDPNGCAARMHNRRTAFFNFGIVEWDVVPIVPPDGHGGFDQVEILALLFAAHYFEICADCDNLDQCNQCADTCTDEYQTDARREVLGELRVAACIQR